MKTALALRKPAKGVPRLIRRIAAALFFIGITLLLLLKSGVLVSYLSWMAKLQFLPAVLAVNLGVVLGVWALTLLLGRLYCSVICPLGVWQDLVSALRARRKAHRFRFRKARRPLQLGFLGLLAAGLAGAFLWDGPEETLFSLPATLLDPYANWGRIVSNLFQPLLDFSAGVWLRSFSGLFVSLLILLLVSILAAWKGRIWCNTVCPVGTFLGFFSPYALIKPRIDFNACIGCRKCERDCKSSCIDIPGKKIDYSRCVSCYTCIDECPVGALSLKVFRGREQAVPTTEDGPTCPMPGPDLERRALLSTLALSLPLAALAKQTDGLLTPPPAGSQDQRMHPPVPAGAGSLDHLSRHCTGCGLCISKCPARVLRPSSALNRLFQPEMQFDRGWCPPGCTLCGEVCPSGAIKKITPEEKTAIHIGHAVWEMSGCLPVSDGISCGQCARNCPAGAIRMVKMSDMGILVKEGDGKLRIPQVNESRCIGCGACEHACPAEPVPAIHVEGHLRHVVSEPNLRLLRQKNQKNS